MFGLGLDTMHQIINDAGEQIRKGNRYADGGQTDDLLDGFPCAFRAVRPEKHGTHLTYAQWFYRGSDFPTLQMVWPDRNSQFPWDADFEERFRADQPKLYE